MHAIATAIGSIKYGDFKAFLDSLTTKKKSLDDALAEGKKKGLPIEDK